MEALKPLVKGVQVGADIGQRIDPTAIVVAERQLRDYRMHDRLDHVTVGGDIHYVIHFIARLPLRTPYPEVAERLAEIYKGLSEAAHGPNILIDATGVGTPVVDLVRSHKVKCIAVYLTGGEKATRQMGELHLAKGLMVSRLQVLLQQQRIHLPQTEEAEATKEELRNYEIKVTESAKLQMGVFKTGAHDDLATALGLACWDVPQGQIAMSRENWGPYSK